MADRYWVGGTGTWDTTTTTNWSATSGGAGGASAPTLADNVIIDGSSGTGTITTSSPVCADLTVTASQAITLSGALNVYGSLAFPSGGSFTFSNSGLTFRATTTGKTIADNNKIQGTVTFNGVGGGWTLTTALGFANFVTLVLEAGTFNTGNFNIQLAGGTSLFLSGSSNTATATRAINLGSSTLSTVGGSSSVNSSATNTGLTFNAGTSTFVGGANGFDIYTTGLTYYTVSFTRSGGMTGTIRNTNTFTNVIVSASSSLTLYAPITITGTLTTNGTSTGFASINSSVVGTQRNITTAAVSLSSTSFQDINAVTAFTAPFGTANLGNNTGITFDSSTAYWIGGTGNWTDSAHWSLSSGGSTANGIPQLTNNVVFDANSNVGTGAFTVTVPTASSLSSCNDFSTSSLDGMMTLSIGGTNYLNVYGSLTWPTSNFTASITATGGSPVGLNMCATTTGKTITTGGQSITGSLCFTGVGGGWTLTDTLTVQQMVHTAGTFNTANQTINAVGGIPMWYITGSLARTINLGSSTVNTTGFNINGSNLTFNAGTSQINVTASNFMGIGISGLTFYNVTYAGSSPVLGANLTYNNLTFTLPSANGTTVLNVSSNVTINGTFAGSGGGGTVINRLWIKSDTTAIQRTITCNAVSGLANMDFKDIVFTGSAAPISGSSFGNSGNNSGITFTAAKTVYWNLAGTLQTWMASGGWATTNNGTPAVANLPLAQDTAVFTEAGAAGSVRLGSGESNIQLPNITCADGVSNRVTTFTLYFDAASTYYFNGNFTGFANLIVFNAGSNGFVFQKQGTQTIIGGGNSILSSMVPTISSGSNFTLGDNNTFSSISVSTGGTLILNDKTAICSSISVNGTVNSNTSGAINLTGTGTVWSASGATITGNGQIIISTTSGAVTFAGGNLTTYPKLTLGNGTGTTAQVTITGSNAFNEISSNAFGGTLFLTAGTTQTVTNFTYGGYKDTPYTIVYANLNSTSSTPANLVKGVSGTINTNYLKVSYVNVTPTSTWYALNSLSVIGANTGWAFSGYFGNYGYADAGNPIENKYVTKDYVMTYYPDLIPGLQNGELYCCGYNGYGQLGDNTTVNKSSLTKVAGSNGWKSLVQGYLGINGGAIKSDSTMWFWGYSSGGSQTSSPSTAYTTGTSWKKMAFGRTEAWPNADLTIAIKTDGTLWEIQSGNPATQIASAAAASWNIVSGGYGDRAAVKTDGTLWTWGLNDLGQLGDGTTSLRTSPITTAGGGTNWKQVACGYKHVAAIKTDGTLWSWGRNSSGQLGNGTTTSSSSPGTTAGGGTNWKQVACGYNGTAAIKTDGTLWTWGSGGSGQIGDGTTSTRSSPVTTVLGGTNWKQVSCGDNHKAAIKTDGTLWTWGYNGLGQLGDGTTSTRSSPVTTVLGGTNWYQVSCGSSHTMALKNEYY